MNEIIKSLQQLILVHGVFVIITIAFTVLFFFAGKSIKGWKIIVILLIICLTIYVAMAFFQLYPLLQDYYHYQIVEYREVEVIQVFVGEIYNLNEYELLLQDGNTIWVESRLIISKGTRFTNLIVAKNSKVIVDYHEENLEDVK